MTEQYDVVVIGAGPAGVAAGITAHKAGAKTLILERDTAMGGILRQCVHNGFGLHYFGEELTGPQYAQRLANRALALDGLDIATGAMVIETLPDKTIRAMQQGVGVRTISAGAIVLATGCRERTRGNLRIPGNRPAGVFTAGTAQRLININGQLPGRRVVILGSGDIGLIMARRMTWEGAKVLCVAEVAPYPGGLARNVAQCLTDFDIPLYLRHTVARIHGKNRVEGVTLAQVDERYNPIAGTEFDLECDTLLLSVGLIPENELAQRAGIVLDPATGGAVVDQNCATNLPGYYACGNALIVNDLADDASRQGECAGQAAAEYALHGQAAAPAELRPVVAGPNIRLCVPQQVTLDCDQTSLWLRVAKPLGAGVIEAHAADGTLLGRITRPALLPGSMESLPLKQLQQTCGPITVTAHSKA